MIRTTSTLAVSRDRLLAVQNLGKAFGFYQALADISFDISEREILGLIGPNGAGKTTLLECLAGLLPADGGMITRWGTPLLRDRRKDVMFYLPDGVGPYPDQCVAPILDFFCRSNGTRRERCAEIIRRLALEPVLAKRIGALSKGYRRRLLLAVALLAPQPLLLLDEPFDGLDLRQTQGVMELLRQERATGRTLLLSIHQLTDAQRICDRFLLLSAGRLIGSGSLEELRRQTGLTNGGLEDVFLALT